MEHIPPNSSVEPEDRKRLSRQARDILQLFQSQETVTTSEMAEIARQYNARLYELRRAGYMIPMVKRMRGGNNIYRMVRGLIQQEKLF